MAYKDYRLFLRDWIRRAKEGNFYWSDGTPKPINLVNSLSVEGTRDSVLSLDEWNALTAFRHLNRAARILAATRALKEFNRKPVR